MAIQHISSFIIQYTRYTALFLLCTCTSFITAQNQTQQDISQHEVTSTINNILTYINKHNLNPVNNSKLLDGALRGIFESLNDPYSVYHDATEVEQLTQITTGNYAGIGLYISNHYINNTTTTEPQLHYIEIISPIEDSPAFIQGLHSKDLIIAINNESTQTMGSKKAADLLRGKPDTDVVLTIQRNNHSFTVSLTRKLIELPTIKYAMITDTDIAYLRIVQFTAKTPTHVIKALTFFAKNNYQKLIIDLRNNHGGSLDAAVSIANMFIKQGPIVSLRGRVKSENQFFNATATTLVENFISIAVLINAGSASASEILAGSLHDHERAQLFGQTSYGKGVVQTVRFKQTSQDKTIGFRLTVAEYFTPNDTPINKIGITPEHKIALRESNEQEIIAVVQLKKEQRISQFIQKYPNPSAQQIQQFITQLQQQDKFAIDTKLLQRLIKIELSRVNNTELIYDLDWDTELVYTINFLQKNSSPPAS